MKLVLLVRNIIFKVTIVDRKVNWNASDNIRWNVYSFSFLYSLCDRISWIEFSVFIILSDDIHKPKLNTSSTKSLLRVDLWRWIPSPTARGVSLIWLYALALLLWKLYCSWQLVFIIFITNSDKMLIDFSISFLCVVGSHSFLGPQKIQLNKSSSWPWYNETIVTPIEHPLLALFLVEFLSWQFLLLERYSDSYGRYFESSFQQLCFDHGKSMFSSSNCLRYRL